MNILKLTFFFALALLFHNSIQAQEWVSYQSEQQINDLVETEDELLMATDAGLVVMNKATLEKTIYNIGNSSLSNNHIQSITQSADGNTWIGTYDVILARFDGSDFVDATIPDSDFYDQFTELYDLKVAPNGDLWAGTTDGVFHRQGQDWSHYGTDVLGADFFEAWDIEINEDGDVFLGANDIHKLSNGVWSIITDTTQLSGYLHSELFFTSSGDLFVAGDLDRIGRFDGTQWIEYDDFGMALNGSQIKKFAEDTNGDIYFQTLYNGIFKLEGNSWIQQSDAQTVAFDNQISYLHIDEQNRRWLNRNIHLAVNTNGNLQSTLISDYTIKSNSIINLHKDHNGKMYFVTYSDTNISVVDANGNWSFFDVPSAFNDMLFIADNNIWLATNEGLYHYDGNAWSLNELQPCESLAVDSEGTVYARNLDRIYIVKNNVITEYNVDNSSIADLLLSTIGVDENDNLWIGSFNWDNEYAIQKVSIDGTWTTYIGGADEPVINRRPEGDFHFDADGNVWVPSAGAGVFKFDGNNWTNPYIGNFDLIENIYAESIESDATGKMYFGHQYGITTLLDGEWENFINENVRLNGSHTSKIQFDNEGTLWWASTIDGVFTFTPGIIISTSSGIGLNADFSIFPNPATQYANINFTTKENVAVNIAVYNSLGQLQSTLNLGQMPVGTFQQRISLASFPKGLYHISVQINDQSVTKNLIVQ